MRSSILATILLLFSTLIFKPSPTNILRDRVLMPSVAVMPQPSNGTPKSASSSFQEQPAPAKIIDRVETDKKVVALTFDADETYGMRSRVAKGIWPDLYDARIVNTLLEKQVPATIFASGLWIEDHKEITSSLDANPLFEFANHSYSHPGFRPNCYKLSNLPDSADESEILKTEELLRLYAPHFVRLFRFPGMCYQESDIKIVQDLGYTIVHADAGGDSYISDPDILVSKVNKQVRAGSIIVFHFQGGPSAPGTVLALPRVIEEIKARGFTFIKLSDLLKINN